MKTVNKNRVCEEFVADLDKANQYIEKCKIVFKENDQYLSYSYENAILLVYKAFEAFIKRIMISCLNHDHSCFEEKYGIALGRHINDDVCEFLITKGGYFDFRGYSGLISIIKGTLGNENAVVPIIKDSYQSCIDQLCASRNYAAHESKQSKEAAKKAFGLRQIGSAGSCLKQQNRYSNIVSSLTALANDIKCRDIY